MTNSKRYPYPTHARDKHNEHHTYVEGPHVHMICQTKVTRTIGVCHLLNLVLTWNPHETATWSCVNFLTGYMSLDCAMWIPSQFNFIIKINNNLFRVG